MGILFSVISKVSIGMVSGLCSAIGYLQGISIYSDEILTTFVDIIRNDYDRMDNPNDLSEARLDSYTGTLQGMKNDSKAYGGVKLWLLPAIDLALKFVSLVCSAQLPVSYVVVIGILIIVLKEIIDRIDVNCIHDILERTGKSINNKTQQLSAWAHNVFNK